MLLGNAVSAPSTAAASPAGPPGVLPSADGACSKALLAAAPGSGAVTEMRHLAMAWRASYKRYAHGIRD